MAEPKSLDEYLERLRVKHYSLRTEDAYLHWARRFIHFHGKRHPREMGGPEVEAFLSHLAIEGCEITVRDGKGGRGVKSPLDRVEQPIAEYRIA